LISEIHGTVLGSGSDWLKIKPDGIGIVVQTYVTDHCLTKSKIQDEVRLFTHLHTTDDGPSLFGFIDKQELVIFQNLITVSGVGPRLALRVLSELAPDTTVRAINSSDEKTLQSVSGIGARTAARLIVELKGKIAPTESEGTSDSVDGFEEALEALVSLGYSRTEALDGLAASAKPGMSVESQISEALRQFAGAGRNS
tara:strand:- start:4231 stop:4824 length:594 start_codon:yes stop_codon:yes gene_type:complete